MVAATVFDTNAYQALASRVLDAMLVAERSDGITTCADSWVVLELAAKLAQEESRPHARAALKKLWYHCGADDFRMVADCEEQICKMLFGRAPAHHEIVRDRLQAITAIVAHRGSDEAIDDVLDAANELAGHVNQIEDERVNVVLNGIIRAIEPKADWRTISQIEPLRAQALEWLDSEEALLTLAESEIRKAHKSVGVRLPDPVPEDMVHDLLEQFRYPLSVENASIRKVVANGWDLSRPGRRNAIWDVQIAFNAGQLLGAHGTITLVTNDELLLGVARDIAMTHVQSLPQYLTARGIAA